MSKTKKQRKASYRKRQKNTTSIYFLLLAVFYVRMFGLGIYGIR